MMRKRRLRAALSFRCSTSRFGESGVPQHMTPREKLLLRLSSAQFAHWELHLYLDTHPNDMQALAMAKQYANMVSSLVEEYECKYGPLSPRCGSGAEWLRNPWPWDYSMREGC